MKSTLISVNGFLRSLPRFVVLLEVYRPRESISSFKNLICVFSSLFCLSNRLFSLVTSASCFSYLSAISLIFDCSVEFMDADWSLAILISCLLFGVTKGSPLPLGVTIASAFPFFMPTGSTFFVLFLIFCALLLAARLLGASRSGLCCVDNSF